MSEVNQNESHLSSQGYSPLSPRLIMQLAAPHTWPAAVIPVLFATCAAFTTIPFLSISMVLVLLCICILMQAAVNTLNDYYDYVKGADSFDNQMDPEDAVLVFNNINPRSVLILALVFSGAALLLGVYVVFNAGWIPLLIGIIGALIIVLYSAGKSPISYLPIGEFVSGITMGGLIVLASYQALTGLFDWMILLLSLPLMIGIGLILFTNNTCDIEKDILAKRKTSAVLLGRDRARKVYHVALGAWLVSIIVLTALFFERGVILCLFMLLLMYPALSAMIKNPLTLETRVQAMTTCLFLNIGLGVFYSAAILFNSTGFIVF